MGFHLKKKIVKKSRPGATTVWANARTECNSKKKKQLEKKKKLASEESRGKDWEGGEVGVTLSLSQTIARLASLAKFFVSPTPIFLFHFFLPMQPLVPGYWKEGKDV